MQLERLAVELRPRNGFESLDLGFAMYGAWRGALMRAWLVTYVPTAIVVSLVLWQYPTIAFFFMWWLKPLFDRVLLHVYSQATFGVVPGARDVLRAVPRLLRDTRLLAGLTTFRFSMARSLFLPVWQLEDQRGPPARARRRVLGARTYGYAVWLTFVCANVATLWMLGAVTVVRLLLPDEIAPLVSFADLLLPDPDSLALQRCLNLLMFAADTVIEPYFVGAGFSLYLNRRSDLEGWDLEIEFRRMATRHASKRAPLAAAASVLIVFFCTALTPSDAHAEQHASTPIRIQALPLAQGEVRREAKAVIDDPVFGERETSSRWIPRARTIDDRSPWLRSLREFMRSVALALGQVGRVAIWVVGGLALALAIYLLIKHRERWRARHGPRVLPQTVFGLDVRPTSLPADVVAAARAAIASGDAPGALSLLYRGALSTLIHAGGVDFRSGDTESECFRRAAPVLSADGGAYFLALLEAWRITAYAHRPPPRADLETLCDRWPAHFRLEAFAQAATQ